LNQNLPNRRTV